MKTRIVFLILAAVVLAACGHNDNETNGSLGLSKTQPVSAATSAKQFEAGQPAHASSSSNSH